jgi:hypothetical protein
MRQAPVSVDELADMKRYYAGENWREWLDTMTYEDYIVKVMGLNPAVARWVDPSMAGGIGMGSDVLSATAAAQIRLPGFQGFTGTVTPVTTITVNSGIVTNVA